MKDLSDKERLLEKIADLRKRKREEAAWEFNQKDAYLSKALKPKKQK